MISVAETPGTTIFRAAPEPEPIFGWSEPRAGADFLRRLPLHLIGKQKEKPCSCIGNGFSSIYTHIKMFQNRI